MRNDVCGVVVVWSVKGVAGIHFMYKINVEGVVPIFLISFLFES